MWILQSLYTRPTLTREKNIRIGTIGPIVIKCFAVLINTSGLYYKNIIIIMITLESSVSNTTIWSVSYGHQLCS
jgi:hypothetical protein